MLKLFKKLEELTEAGVEVRVKAGPCECHRVDEVFEGWDYAYGKYIETDGHHELPIDEIEEISYEVDDITETLVMLYRNDIDSTFNLTHSHEFNDMKISEIRDDEFQLKHVFGALKLKDVKSISYQQDHIKVTVIQNKKVKSFKELLLQAERDGKFDEFCKVTFKNGYCTTYGLIQQDFTVFGLKVIPDAVKKIEFKDGSVIINKDEDKQSPPLGLTGKTFIEQLRLIRDETDLMGKECEVYYNYLIEGPYKKFIVSFDDDLIKYKSGWDNLHRIASITFSNGLTIVNEEVKAKEPTMIDEYLKEFNDKSFSEKLDWAQGNTDLFNTEVGGIIHLIDGSAIEFLRLSKVGKILQIDSTRLIVISNITEIYFRCRGSLINKDNPMTLRDHLVKLMNDKTVCQIKSMRLYEDAVITNVDMDKHELEIIEGTDSQWLCLSQYFQYLTYTDKHGRKVTVKKDGSVDVEGKWVNQHEEEPVKPKSIDHYIEEKHFYERLSKLPLGMYVSVKTVNGPFLNKLIRVDCVGVTLVSDSVYNRFIGINLIKSVRYENDDGIMVSLVKVDNKEEDKPYSSVELLEQFFTRNIPYSFKDAMRNDEPKKKSFYEELKKAESEGYFKYPCDVFIDNGKIVKGLFIKDLIEETARINFKNDRWCYLEQISYIDFNQTSVNYRIKNLDE